MKKHLLAAAALATAAFAGMTAMPTTSEAIPAFARQTGSACLSCHFQSIPTLAAFGRSFKMNALTDVGEQALVEDEHLSIPAVLNATVVFRPQIQTQKTNAGTAKSISYGDQVVLIGGRIGENAGAFIELGGGAFGNHQLFTSFGDEVKFGINYYNTGFGEDAGLQLMNVWGQHGGMMDMRIVSANQNIFESEALAGGQFAGAVVWAGNEMGAVQLGMVAPSVDAATWGNAGNSTFKAAPMVRANGFFDVGGMELGVGAIVISGNVGDNGQYLGPGIQAKLNRWGIDAQLQGETGDLLWGVYVDYASAGSSSPTSQNLYNTTTKTVNGWSLRGTVKPMHNLVLGIGYGELKRGLPGDAKQKTFHIAAEYEIYQNFVVALTYTDQKGSGFTAGAAGTVKTTTIDIEALM